jgi:hypothetical protein
MQTFLRDKMPPQKVKIQKQNKWDLAKLEKGCSISTFLKAFYHKNKFACLKSSEKSRIFNTQHDLFQEKNVISQKGPYQIFQHKNQKR